MQGVELCVMVTSGMQDFVWHAGFHVVLMVSSGRQGCACRYKENNPVLAHCLCCDASMKQSHHR